MEAARMIYVEKLKDPRWQKRKAEVCAVANWKCQDCGGEDKNLHVHHKRYLKDGTGKMNDPWEYSDGDLVCVCMDCHGLREQVAASSRILFQQVNPQVALAFLAALSAWGADMESEIAHLTFYCKAHLHNERCDK